MPFWTLRRKFAVGALALVVLAFGWAAMVVAVALVATRDQARTADAIVVLGAAQYNGRPSPVFRARLAHAAAAKQRTIAAVGQEPGRTGPSRAASCGSPATPCASPAAPPERWR